MTKERLVAFTDAVLAIIMTILILELEKPKEITLAGLWDLRIDFLAYALSFFWLGIMWVNMHRGWHEVKQISNKVVWNTLFLLFFSSFFPYVTSIVSKHFENRVAQVLYGIVILLVTVFNLLMYRSLYEIPENKRMATFMKSRSWMTYDVGIKVIGLGLSLTIFPPAILYSILVILILFVLPLILKDYQNGNSD